MIRNGLLNMFPRSADNGRPSDDMSEALALLRNFEESNKGWFWSTDSFGKLSYISPGVSARANGAADVTSGIAFSDLFVPAEDGSSVRERLPFLLGRHLNFEKLILQAVNSNGSQWWEVSGRPQFDRAGCFTGYRGYGIDVTEQRHSSESASRLAVNDPLTGLQNRLRMSQCLEEGLASLSQAGRSCAVLLVDLDRFKQVNDSLGHPAGDALLKQVAARLVATVRDREKIFRLGGDEFQVILPDCDDRGALGTLANEIIASLSQPYSVDGSRCVIGASVGLAVGPFDGRTSEDLMRNADLALYAAKASGRGCFRFFSQDLLQEAEEKRVLEEDLRDALANGQLKMYYQPLVSTQNDGVTGVEALVRWHHPKRGPISPALFIPIAEEANLIDQLGEWILRTACNDAAGWPGSIRVAVNVSPIQFANANLPRIVMSALANSGLSPGRLELELTEGIFLGESAKTDTMFATLKDIGVRLALDDFGTGYSSLGYLKTAPFDKIKIDQSFVREATLPKSRNRAIIAAIVALAGALDMETTAEGVESLDQLALIRSLGVSHVQGFVYSKAIDSDALAKSLESGAWTIQPTGPAKQRSDRRSMYRKVGVIAGAFYHPALIRNLSETGALIDGIADLVPGTQILVDFGECQLAVATVRRSEWQSHGIAFNQPLVSDGIGGLCTSHRVSPYLLSKIGLTTSGQATAKRLWDPTSAFPIERLVEALGLSLLAQTPSLLDISTQRGPDGDHKGRQPDSTGGSQVAAPRHAGGYGTHVLTADELERLKYAVEISHNPQLRNIIALLIMTGARPEDLLTAKWDDIDLAARIWRIPTVKTVTGAEILLSDQAAEIVIALPRWDDCPFVIANPRTKKPYNSIAGSWDAARKKAGLDNIGIHDLRHCNANSW